MASGGFLPVLSVHLIPFSIHARNPAIDLVLASIEMKPKTICCFHATVCNYGWEATNHWHNFLSVQFNVITDELSGGQKLLAKATDDIDGIDALG